MTDPVYIGRFRCPLCGRIWKHRTFIHFGDDGSVLHCVWCAPDECPHCNTLVGAQIEALTGALRWGVRHHLGGSDAGD